jgi:DNA modification methylase
MTFANKSLFSCDALTLLERLPSESVKLIYFDPPFNSKINYLINDSNSDNFTDEQYIYFLSKVIQQGNRILKNDGSFFFRWSQTSSLDIRLLINQVFNSQPEYEITWPIRKILGNSIDNKPKLDNEVILVYSKSEFFTYNQIFLPLSDDYKAFFKFKDDKGFYKRETLITRSNFPYNHFNWRGYELPENSSWRFSFNKLEDLVLENKIDFSSVGSLPTLKRYLDDHLGIELGTHWGDISNFPPMEDQTTILLMKRIIQIASNEGDLVVDPFCRLGTTLIAAQLLKRNWWGADNSIVSYEIIIKRLFDECNAEVNKDYNYVKNEDILKQPLESFIYKDILSSISEINKLQQDLLDLTNHIFSLKKLMNVDVEDNEKIEEVINQMQYWINTSLKRQAESVDDYVDTVCLWLTGWEKLDNASQLFLPQAELLFENISRTRGKDYSPFIIQYCRALENELLIKLFIAYTDDLYLRHENINEFLNDEIENEKTGKFIKAIRKRENSYTLGDMNFIMNLIKLGGKTLENSLLLKDFRSFAIRYFGEKIIDKTYLDKIHDINKDFRCKAAHTGVLDFEVAQKCRVQVRSCLNELIFNYQGSNL